MKRFKDRSAVITGAGDGIGQATAYRLGREGARIALCDINKKNLADTLTECEKQGIEAKAYPMDITDEGGVKKTFEDIDSAFGKIDICINSAGVAGQQFTRISSMPIKEFDLVHNVNMRGSFIVAKYALTLMEKHNSGRLLLITSIAGKEGNATMTPYSSSKAGVIGLVKALGQEYAQTGITVNGLAPAVIYTSMMQKVDPEKIKVLVEKIPMNRLGTVEEVAAMNAFIVSDECSFSTGFVFDASGGRATY